MLIQEELMNVTSRWNKILKKDVVVADGDSWFDYPRLFAKTDILDQLEKLSYYVENAAHHGDTLEGLANDDEQHEQFMACLQELNEADKKPCAILLSAGGNDFTKKKLEGFLQPKGSDESDSLNTLAMSAAFDKAEKMFVSIVRRVTEQCHTVFGRATPIILHGYANPIPDGTDYSPWPWRRERGKPGPWLKCAFDRRGHESLQENTKTMARILEAFNVMVEKVTTDHDLGDVRYADFRPCLRNDLDYKLYWRDELHPTDLGFRQIATKLDEIIRCRVSQM